MTASSPFWNLCDSGWPRVHLSSLYPRFERAEALQAPCDPERDCEDESHNGRRRAEKARHLMKWREGVPADFPEDADTMHRGFDRSLLARDARLTIRGSDR